MRALSKYDHYKLRSSVRIYYNCISINKVINNDLAGLGKQEDKKEVVYAVMYHSVIGNGITQFRK